MADGSRKQRHAHSLSYDTRADSPGARLRVNRICSQCFGHGLWHNGRVFSAAGIGGEELSHQSTPTLPTRLGRWSWLVAVGPLLPVMLLGFFNDDYAILDYVESAPGSQLLGYIHKAGFEFFRPAAILLFRAEYLLFGVRAQLFHAVNLGLLLVAAILAAKLLSRLAGRSTYAWAAAASLLYPARFEALAWVAALPDLLALVLLSSALLVLLETREVPSASRLVALGVLGFLTPLAKESGFALPLVALAWEFLGLLPPIPVRARVLRCGAVVSGSLAAAVLRTCVLGGMGGYRDTSIQAALHSLRGLVGMLVRVILVPVNPTFGLLSRAIAGACLVSALFLLVAAARSRCWRVLAGALSVVLGGLLPPIAYLHRTELAWSHNRLVTITGLGVVLLLLSGLEEASRWRRLAASTLLVAWTAASLINLTAWLQADARRQLIVQTVERVTRAAGRHKVWIAGRIDDYYRGTRLAGHLPEAVRRAMPGRDVVVDSEHLQRYQGRPLVPPCSESGVQVHLFRFDPLTPELSPVTPQESSTCQ